MSYGFVYFLTNPCMPGVTKIGMTTKHPRDRMAELTASTSCPQPFEMLAFFDTATPAQAEREIHQALDKYRINDRREFFRAPLIALQNQARCWGDSNEGCFCLSLLDFLIDEEEFEQAKKWREDLCAWMAEH